MTADDWDYETFRLRWQRTHHFACRVPAKTRRARSGEVVYWLKWAIGLTGDPRFAAAIEATKEHKLDRLNSKTLQRVVWRPIERTCIRRMQQLLRVQTRSMRWAAARTANEFHIEAQSFDAVVRRLERAYRAHLRDTEN
jgi:hypothetical protein